MNLEAIYFVSQAVAALALIGSLIFVGLQIRQTREANNSARDVLAGQGLRAAHERLIDPTFSELSLKAHFGEEELSDTDLLRYIGFSQGMLTGTQTTYEFWQRGEAAERTWKPLLHNLETFMVFPVFRVAYRGWRDTHATPDFRELANGLHDRHSTAPRINPIEQFRQELATEISDKQEDADQVSSAVSSQQSVKADL